MRHTDRISLYEILIIVVVVEVFEQVAQLLTRHIIREYGHPTTLFYDPTYWRGSHRA